MHSLLFCTCGIHLSRNNTVIRRLAFLVALISCLFLPRLLLRGGGAWNKERLHILTEALSWHQRFLDTGDMRV